MIFRLHQPSERSHVDTRNPPTVGTVHQVGEKTGQGLVNLCSVNPSESRPTKTRIRLSTLDLSSVTGRDSRPLSPSQKDRRTKGVDQDLQCLPQRVFETRVTEVWDDSEEETGPQRTTGNSRSRTNKFCSYTE